MRARDWWVATVVCVAWAAAVVGAGMVATARILHTIQDHLESDED